MVGVTVACVPGIKSVLRYSFKGFGVVRRKCSRHGCSNQVPGRVVGHEVIVIVGPGIKKKYRLIIPVSSAGGVTSVGGKARIRVASSCFQIAGFCSGQRH